MCIDWIRAHLPTYSAIGGGTNSSSMTSSMSSSQPNQNNARPISRHIQVNSEQQPAKYCSNEISTCKYNVVTFLPRFLIEQFRRYSNVFFLCIAILQQIPEVSPTGKYTTAVPFLLILLVSAIKEAFEDLKRRRMDIQVNNYKVEMLRGNRFQTCKWQELKVGNIVKISEGNNFPADVVLLSSSEEFGMAYIETAQLDGETNLKIRQALPNTAGFSNVEKIRQISAEIECELPNRKVTEFTGTMKIGGDRVPLSITQLLLRGAKLKNCKWIFGVVIYTGHDSRLLMNSTTAPLKSSRIDIMTNRRILFLFMMLIAITVVSVIGAEVFNRIVLLDTFYLERFHTWSFLWNALTFFILYNNLIPISLQVTLEIIRFFQAGYINQDMKMYDEANDIPANARTSNLNEELGQVQYLMTDKTGTLTRNVMKFKRCHIGRMEYGHDEKEEFDDPNLLKDMHNGKENSQLINEFLTMMASCHTAVPERNEEGEINYQATSPDEGALVRGAAINGFAFHTRKPTEISIETPNGRKHFELLNIIEFTSDRKRMSVIVRDESRRIKLFCKGADNVIFERLSNEQNLMEHLNDSKEAIDKYANKGYRTLCFAMRELDANIYREWVAKFKDASTALEERENKLKAVAEEIEKDLLLIGITAIEDKLQENVPSTIRTLLDAGIHIWMLTGDKLETAIQIAQSSSICSKHTKLMKIAEKSYDSVLAKLRRFKNESHRYLESGTEFALVIDGASLHHAVTGEARRIFAELIVDCYSVICCRMTPMQKAEIVEIVKTLEGKTVLAVGDGANDVAMIQAANVGVGITGEEGLQAASASDYSIAQFQYLQRLILIHGTWNYERTVKVILYSFYKNICLYIIELWFAFFSAFSGVTIFERWSIAMFNVIFTALPPIILGLFDRPISQRLILSHPEIYQSFQKMAFSNFRFILWIGVSLWHSLMLFFLTYFIYGAGGILWETGRNGGWLLFGNSLYTFVVATVCIKAMLECDSWTWVIAISCFGSMLSWFIFLAFYSLTWHFIPLGAEMHGMFGMMVSSVTFWLSFIFVPIFTLFADFIIKGFCTSLRPSPREILCQKEKRKTQGCHGCNVTNMDGGGQLEEVRHTSSIPLVKHQNRHHSPSPSPPNDSTNFPPTNNTNRTSFYPHSSSHSTEQTSIIPKPNNFSMDNYGATYRRAANGNNNFETIIEEGNDVENHPNFYESKAQQGNCKNTSSRITFTTRRPFMDSGVAYRHSTNNNHSRSSHFPIHHPHQNGHTPLFSQHHTNV